MALVPEIQTMILEIRSEPTATQDQFKTRLYDFFERELTRARIPLGNQSGIFDFERTTIDTAIIHHTSQPPGLSPARLSAIELIRLYAPYFANPTSEQDKAVKGEPIYSGHVRNGQQVFWPYHWIVRTSGRAERLLRDDEIGWHAGDWDVNCKSVAIVFDGDYEHASPSDIQLRAVAQIIAQHYPNVSHDNVMGHREVNSRTTCPSRQFITSDGRGWKQKLLSISAEIKNAR